jgi:hypothetical protein
MNGSPAVRGVPRAALALLALLAACGSTTNEPPAPPAGTPPPVLAWPDPLPPASPDALPLGKGLAVGTWEPAAPGDFAEAFVDEAGLRVVFTNAKAGRRTWRGFAGSGGRVPLDALLGQRAGEEVAYVYSLVQRATATATEYPDAAAVLHLRHRGRVRAWFDGRLVLDEAPAADGWRETRVPVVLTGPFDVLLLKCGRGSPALGASLDVELRISAPDGTPLPGAAFNSMRPGDLPSDI